MPSFDRPDRPPAEPSPWVVRFAPLIEPGGLVLDLACGHGRHARHLAELGHRVVAADIDVAGLNDLADDPQITVLERDLEAHPWPFDAGQFDGIVVANYLHRAHFPLLVDALAEGGVLLFDTFGAGNELLGRPRNPQFLLQPGELWDAVASALTVIAYEHGSETTPRPAVRQRLCAAKRAAPCPLLAPEPWVI